MQLISRLEVISLVQLTAAALLLSAGCAARATPVAGLNGPGPQVYCLNPHELAVARARVEAGDAALEPAYQRLLRDAAKTITQPPLSVTQKTVAGPSGDLHDYVSLSKYWWPSESPSSPWQRRDGEIDPATQDASRVDDKRLFRLTYCVETLALAYYFSHDDSYAKHCSLLLRAWFLDPATRMNPNLKFAQSVPGVSRLPDADRGEGILDGGDFIRIDDSVGLLAGSPSWTAADQAGMKSWMNSYLDWLGGSAEGKDEQGAPNNHGTWYDAQYAALCLFTGRPQHARDTLQAAKQSRFDTELASDGSQPREMKRTKSLSYSLFNATALEDLASEGDRAGVSLWNYRSSQGGSLEKAVDYTGPYAGNPSKWPGKQITDVKTEEFLPVLDRAYLHYGESSERSWIDQAVGALDKHDDRTRLLYPDAEARR